MPVGKRMPNHKPNWCICIVSKTQFFLSCIHGLALACNQDPASISTKYLDPSLYPGPSIYAGPASSSTQSFMAIYKKYLKNHKIFWHSDQLATFLGQKLFLYTLLCIMYKILIVKEWNGTYLLSRTDNYDSIPTPPNLSTAILFETCTGWKKKDSSPQYYCHTL